MRAPDHAIPAPPFPGRLPWVNVASLRMDKQRGRPVLVEFWDFCRVNSLRTMPYLKAWHARYAARRAAGDRRAHRRLPPRARDRARRRRGRPARDRVPRRDRRASSRSGTSTATRAGRRGTSGTSRVRCTRCTTARAPTTRPSARSRRCSASSASSSRPCARRTRRACCSRRRPRTSRAPTAAPTRPAACGRCSTATGEVTAGGRAVAVDGPGCVPLIEHPHHTEGVLDLAIGPGVTCHATCFTPGVAAPGGSARPASG